MRNLRTWEEEVAETRMLVNFIKTKIRLSNEATIKNRALKFINPLDIDKDMCKVRIDKVFSELDTLGVNSYDNDIARAIVYAILRNDKKKYLKLNISEHNLYSYDHSSRQYDPRKNGANILKHGLSFQEALQIMGGTVDHSLTTWTRVQNKQTQEYENRHVVYAKLNGKNEYMLAIVIFPTDENREDEYKKVGIIAKQVMDEFGVSDDNGATLSVELSNRINYEVIRRSKQAMVLANETEPMRFISAWKFDASDFDRTVMDRIVDEHDEADLVVVDNLKQRSLDILKKAWNVT